ncbi:MAG TPA: hypothetical protein VFV38_12820 [Ktedonobacteraceae bacterium]|nr:hypothetical protein [Ktedonobacteraceae bacterium]
MLGLSLDELIKLMKKHYFTLEWYEVYDFLEYIAGHLKHPEDSIKFAQACNVVLRSELSAYRFVEKKIVPVLSDQQ